MVQNPNSTLDDQSYSGDHEHKVEIEESKHTIEDINDLRVALRKEPK